jgi:Ras homolog gene family, member A
VGTKADLRNEDTENPSSISTLEAQQLADELGAWGYYECSARTGKGVKNVFDNAIRHAMKAKILALREQQRRKGLFSGCTVM